MKIEYILQTNTRFASFDTEIEAQDAARKWLTEGVDLWDIFLDKRITESLKLEGLI